MADSQKAQTKRSYISIRVEYTSTHPFPYAASIELRDSIAFRAFGDDERSAIRNLFKEILHEEVRDTSR
jgi:hypothetical protein